MGATASFPRHVCAVRRGRPGVRDRGRAQYGMQGFLPIACCSSRTNVDTPDLPSLKSSALRGRDFAAERRGQPLMSPAPPPLAIVPSKPIPPRPPAAPAEPSPPAVEPLAPPAAAFVEMASPGGRRSRRCRRHRHRRRLGDGVGGDKVERPGANRAQRSVDRDGAGHAHAVSRLSGYVSTGVSDDIWRPRKATRGRCEHRPDYPRAAPLSHAHNIATEKMLVSIR